MIAMFAEIKKDGQWHKVDKQFESTFEEMKDQLTDRVYDGVNYILYEVLSGRPYKFNKNYSALPRVNVNCGMPDDACEEIKNNSCFDGKDVYYTSLSSLLEYNWNEEISMVGYIDEWQYARLRRDNVLPITIRHIDALQNNKIMSAFELDILIDNGGLRKMGKCFVEYKYDYKQLKDKCSFFCKISIPKLMELIPVHGTKEDVRIVFSL